MTITYRAGEKIDDPLVIGYEFCATMQLRTPLAVLRQHGATIPAAADHLPAVDELWHGIWTPLVAPLVPGMPPFRPSTMASEVGPIPSDGGDYLRLLLCVREVVEVDAPPDFRRALLRVRLAGLPWQDLIAKMGGFERIAGRLLPAFLETIRGLRRPAIEHLWARQLRTPEQLMGMSDQDLLAVPSIGPKLLQVVRSNCAEAKHPQSEFVDAVEPSA